MRLDHIAYRVAQGKRDEAVKFFVDAFGYRIQGEPFEIFFNDAKTDKAMCIALEPPEKIAGMPWIIHPGVTVPDEELLKKDDGNFHLAPELFISEGTPGSIVGDWVASRAGVGGIHHLAYQIEDVGKKMREWTEKGWAQFSTDKPITCPGLTQVFSKPNFTGVIYEFIRREPNGKGFCAENVRQLMIASKGD